MKIRNTINFNRNFTLILYTEDETHLEAIKKIESKYEYACILHDKDKEDNGEIKKEHYHYVIRVGENARWRNAVAEELGISTAYIEGCHLEKQLRYLIHADDLKKYQYDIKNVTGNLKEKLLKSLEKDCKNESEKITEIINFIKSTKEQIYLEEVVEWCIEKDYYNVLKKSSQIIIKIIENRNRRVL